MDVAGLLLVIAKITALFLITAVALWTMRRASASSRHLLITLVFCATLLLPLLAFVLPGWTVVVLEESAGAAGGADQLEDAFPGVLARTAELRPNENAAAIAGTASKMCRLVCCGDSRHRLRRPLPNCWAATLCPTLKVAKMCGSDCGNGCARPRTRTSHRRL